MAHAADASAKSTLVLPFWYRLTRVVPDKGPLNGCCGYCRSRSSLPQNGLHTSKPESLCETRGTSFANQTDHWIKSL